MIALNLQPVVFFTSLVIFHGFVKIVGDMEHVTKTTDLPCVRHVAHCKSIR